MIATEWKCDTVHWAILPLITLINSGQGKNQGITTRRSSRKKSENLGEKAEIMNFQNFWIMAQIK